MPRLGEAGGVEGSSVQAQFAFNVWDGRTAIAGTLNGALVLTCQRCMGPFRQAVNEEFAVVVVDDPEQEGQEIGGHDAVVAEPTRVDLRWLVEEQVLLALPLVPMHAPDECGVSLNGSDRGEQTSEIGQRPFDHLRDLLGKR